LYIALKTFPNAILISRFQSLSEMNPWILFAFMAQSVWAVCTVIDKIVISKGHIKNPFVFITLNGFMNIFILLPIFFFGIEMLPLKQMAAVVVYGLCHIAAVIAYYAAVSHDEISKIKIIDQMGPIIIYMLAFIFLGEVLTSNMLMGFILFISAGMLVSLGRKNGKFELSKAIPLMLLSMTIGSIASIAAKYVYSSTGFWNGLIWLRISGFAGLLVFFAPRIAKDFKMTYQKMPLNYKKLMCFKMVIDFSAFIFYGIAISNGPISIISAFSGAVIPIMVFLIALALTKAYPHILKEDVSSKALFWKTLSIALVIAGIIFVNI
jgi:drug/metabolite transporter (DMT)-like permease